MTAKKTAGRPEFEKALERLEEIVAEMETGSLSLEKMMKSFEEGMGLIGICGEKLNEVEKKIEMLVKKGDRAVAVPFETTDEDANAKT